jgi:hypothetical protein
MKKILVLLLLTIETFAQNKTENVFIITTDGFRWQEVFGGMDAELLEKKEFVRNKDRLTKTFGAGTAEERREKLMPFFWNTMERQQSKRTEPLLVLIPGV